MPVSTLVLKTSPFFAQAPQAALAFAAERMQLQTLRRREVLPPDGCAFDGLGLVLQGGVQAVDLTIDGREAALLSAAPGEVLGLAQLLAVRSMPLCWVASQGPATVAVLARPAALELLQMPEMSLRAARWMAQQLIDVAAWQKFLGLHPVGARVCASLLHLMQADGGLQLPTHAELGWRLNTTRESVTRMLQRLLHEGVLEREGERWRVVDVAALQRLARPQEGSA